MIIIDILIKIFDLFGHGSKVIKSIQKCLRERKEKIINFQDKIFYHKSKYFDKGYSKEPFYSKIEYSPDSTLFVEYHFMGIDLAENLESIVTVPAVLSKYLKKLPDKIDSFCFITIPESDYKKFVKIKKIKDFGGNRERLLMMLMYVSTSYNVKLKFCDQIMVKRLKNRIYKNNPMNFEGYNSLFKIGYSVLSLD